MKPHALKAMSVGMLLLLPVGATIAQDPLAARAQVVFSAEELDNLVAPIALYPDPLLAQILIAATYPDQVSLAARYVRERGTRGVDDESWDLSVRSIAHYPPVLNMLDEDPDWTAALGQAYAIQSADVMDAVQRLREMAREQGNLVSTEEQTVTVQERQIVIVPANPRVIYVPYYDPAVVFFRPVLHLGFRTAYWSFGIGFPIGPWLVYDLDWYGHRVYYDGWIGGGWRVLARPYIRLTPVYVHPRYRAIRTGNVYGQVVNFVNLDRSHRRVHNTVTFVRHERNDRGPDRRAGDWNRDGRGGNGRASGPANNPGGRANPGDRSGRGSGPDRDRPTATRAPTFNSIRPGASGRAETRSEPARSPSGFGVIEKGRTAQPSGPTVIRGTTRPSSAKPTPSATKKSPVTLSVPARTQTQKPQVQQKRAVETRSTPRPPARVQASKPPKASSSAPSMRSPSKSASKSKPSSGKGGKGGKPGH